MSRIYSPQHRKGVIIAVGIGLFSMFIENLFNWPILDPLVLALIMGIIIRSCMKFKDELLYSFQFVPSFFMASSAFIQGIRYF